MLYLLMSVVKYLSHVFGGVCMKLLPFLLNMDVNLYSPSI